MSDYTPGPWGTKKTNDGSTAVFSGETGNWVAAVFKSTPITQQANARLIASAPKLLKALEHAVKIAEGVQAGCWDDLIEYRALISEATGVEP